MHLILWYFCHQKVQNPLINVQNIIKECNITNLINVFESALLMKHQVYCTVTHKYDLTVLVLSCMRY